MAIIGTLPVTLQNGTVADANQVMSDFNFIVNQVNANALPTTALIGGTQLLNIQVFTSSGTYTPTTGTTRAYVEVLGAGGAGGGAALTGGNFSIGGGGGAGAYSRGLIVSPVSGAVVVGAGGTGVAGGTGNTGGNSGFQGLIVCTGGLGGQASAAGGSVQALGGGGGGVSTPGSILALSGANGGSAFGYVTGTIGLAGFGANSAFGGGGIGQVSVNVSGTNANSGGFGAGGSGAFNGGGQAARAGGNGSNGLIIVYEYA